MMTGLLLPRIGPQVPLTVAPGPLLAANATVSRFLIEAEAFGEADIPASWTDSLSACEQALDRWLKREIGPLHCLAPRFALHMLSRDSDDYGDYGGGEASKGFDVGAVEASWCESHEQEWSVGGGWRR